MSLAENLLNSLDNNTTDPNAISEEPHIIIGDDRVIRVPNELKLIAVKNDKNVETVTFDCVRYWDEHDLSTFAIYINYILPNGDEGTYIPEEIRRTDDTFSFDWIIDIEITQYVGKLTFWIVATQTIEGGSLVLRRWSSLQNTECNIAQGGTKIFVPEKQTDQDVISQVLQVSTNAATVATEQGDRAYYAANSASASAEVAAAQATKAENSANTVSAISETVAAQAQRAQEQAERAEAQATKAELLANKLERLYYLLDYKPEEISIRLANGSATTKTFVVEKSQIDFYVVLPSGTVTYSVYEGTTWDEFTREHTDDFKTVDEVGFNSYVVTREGGLYVRERDESQGYKWCKYTDIIIADKEYLAEP